MTAPNAPARDRVVAEAVRILEEGQSKPIDDADVVATINRTGTDADPEARIIMRAKLVSKDHGIDDALDRARAAIRLALLGALVAAAVAGAVAARAALRGGTASVAGLLFGLLGIQSALLVLWLVWLPVRRRFPEGGLLGNAVMAVGRSFARWFAPVKTRSRSAAAVSAIASVHARGRAGVWTASVISHAAWLAFNAGAMVVLAALFLGEGYQFRWDSTWLSAETYRRLIEAVAAGPHRAGFLVPDAAQIEASRVAHGALARFPQDPATREAWSWLFFGALGVYGVVPRLGFLAISLFLRQRALRNDRLDLSRPGFAMLRARLTPQAEIAEPVSGSVSMGDRAPLLSTPSPARPPGSPAIVGLEMPTPLTGWPPRIRATLTDLGIIDGGDDLRRAHETLSRAERAPNPLAIAAELNRAPDRGMERLITNLTAAAGSAPWLILTGGRNLARSMPPDAASQRRDDWTLLAGRAGIPAERVLDIDLDYLTDSTRATLERIFTGSGGGGVAPTTARRLEQAFAAIAQRAPEWDDPPRHRELLDLHVEISRMYGHKAKSWGSRFVNQVSQLVNGGPDSLAPDSAIDALRGVAKSMQLLLPPSLAGKAKWLAAGGLAGALGCLAVSITLAPAAAATLPMWSLLGAAMGAAGSLARDSSAADQSEHPEAPPSCDWEEAVHSAVLFSLILELQGRPEGSITRILARAIDPAEDQFLARERLSGWLDAIRHRFDLAVIDAEKRA